MAENVTNLREDTVNLSRKFNTLQAEQTQRTPYEKYYNQTVKSQIQKENHESSKKEVTHCGQGTLVILTANFLSDTMEARRQWDVIFKVMIHQEVKYYRHIHNK